eukprot:COSAG01_NODE_7212_length_3303_cov_3.954432_3_plen_90_part_00
MEPEQLAQNNALWRGLQEAQRRGLTRAIGVSNYGVSHLAALSGPRPAINQCRMSPTSPNNHTLEYCLAHGIQFEACAPRPTPGSKTIYR